MRLSIITIAAILLVTATGCQSILGQNVGVMFMGKNYREADFGTATAVGITYEMTLLQTLDTGLCLARFKNDVDNKRLSVYGLVRVPLMLNTLMLRVGGGPVYEVTSSTGTEDLDMENALGFEGRASVAISLSEFVKTEGGIIASLSDTTTTNGSKHSVTLDAWIIFVGVSFGF